MQIEAFLSAVCANALTYRWSTYDSKACKLRMVVLYACTSTLVWSIKSGLELSGVCFVFGFRPSLYGIWLHVSFGFSLKPAGRPASQHNPTRPISFPHCKKSFQVYDTDTAKDSEGEPVVPQFRKQLLEKLTVHMRSFDTMAPIIASLTAMVGLWRTKKAEECRVALCLGAANAVVNLKLPACLAKLLSQVSDGRSAYSST